MGWISKHWILFRKAYKDLKHWQDGWYELHYPHSRLISAAQAMIMGICGALGGMAVAAVLSRLGWIVITVQ